MIKKGIVLAGGYGTRLHPTTFVISKQLLPIYDKPMIYYPISTLMLAGIREILLISTPRDIEQYKRLLGNGELWGVSISYKIQPEPGGLAQAFILGEEFIGGGPCALVLGDNIFYGDSLKAILLETVRESDGATIFAYRVSDPQRYGVVEFDDQFKAVSLEEKPESPKSNFAVVGLYFYDAQAVSLVGKLKPSARGELEITDLNRLYLDAGSLNVKVFGRGYAWLDTGTYDSLLAAGTFIETIQKRQGYMIACLEEIAWNQGWIDEKIMLRNIERLKGTRYGVYLEEMIFSEI